MENLEQSHRYMGTWRGTKLYCKSTGEMMGFSTNAARTINHLFRKVESYITFSQNEKKKKKAHRLILKHEKAKASKLNNQTWMNIFLMSHYEEFLK